MTSVRSLSSSALVTHAVFQTDNSAVQLHRRPPEIRTRNLHLLRVLPLPIELEADFVPSVGLEPTNLTADDFKASVFTISP